MESPVAVYPAFGLMVGHLADAARDVFAAFGVPLNLCLTAPEGRADDDPDEMTGMAVIGYAGSGLRGALIMIAAERAVYTWMTAAGVPDGDLADTLGEFSNMLLGRLKERLLPLGISIIATTPTAATGMRVRLSEAPGPGPSSWSVFDGPGWNLRVRLDAEFEPGFAPSPGRLLAWRPKAGDVIDFDVPAPRDK